MAFRAFRNRWTIIENTVGEVTDETVQTFQYVVEKGICLEILYGARG
jgi:hypothetical protein